jgi:hypothetical protein
MELEEGLKLAHDGRALLFVGAGFPRGATNLAGDDFAVGRDLARDLSTEAALPAGLALDDVAELYVNKFGESKLIDELKQLFSAKDVTKAHQDIAALPWRRVYTTNYDDVFELACTKIGKRVDSVVPSDDISQISKKNLLCVHLNGFIRRTDQGSIWNDLKLTQASYDKGSALDNEWGSLFRADLQAAQAVFFVGYSLWDIDIRRLLLEEELRDKSFFVLGLTPDMATAHRAGKYGLLIAAGTTEFAHQLTEFSKTYIPESDTAPVSFCLRSYRADVSPVALEDRNIFELLLFGRLRPDLVAASYLGQIKYCGPRKENEFALSRIESGSRVIVLHSSLGNGKTVTLEGLKYLLFSKGYKVFELVNRGEWLAEELQNALLGSGKKVFFIDNYVEWLDVLATFGSHRSEEFVLVMSARSAAHDVLVDRVADDLGIPEIIEIPLDTLALSDLEWIVDFFNEFGIWGDEASLSRRRKIDFLAETCRGEWQGILLKILESPNIVGKLRNLFSALQKDSPYREPIIRLLILTVLAYRPATPTLVDLCGDQILESAFRRDSVSRELIEFGVTSVAMRSSVTAGVLLREILDPNLTIRALIGLINRADKLANASTYNLDLFKNLVRFSNLHFVFSDRERGRAGMRVYEAVKYLPHCSRSPLFWLQYAIAALVSQDFGRAKAYFENAYSFAGDMYAYDSYQIDNHYARFLLDRVVFQRDAAAAMETFREARILIYSRLQNERRHYPYRVAAQWRTFYGTFRDSLSAAEKSEIRNAAEYVCGRIEALPADRARHRSVIECWDAMQFILADIPPPEARPGSPAAKITS